MVVVVVVKAVEVLTVAPVEVVVMEMEDSEVAPRVRVIEVVGGTVYRLIVHPVVVVVQDKLVRTEPMLRDPMVVME